MSLLLRRHPCQIIDILHDLATRALGSKGVKCVVDENDCVFTSDIETLFSSMDTQHPEVEIIIQALKSHKAQHGQGIRSFLFMVTRIAKAVRQLEELGIAHCISTSIMQETVMKLAKEVRKIGIPVALSTQDSTLKQSLTDDRVVVFSETSEYQSIQEISSTKPLGEKVLSDTEGDTDCTYKCLVLDRKVRGGGDCDMSFLEKEDNQSKDDDCVGDNNVMSFAKYNQMKNDLVSDDVGVIKSKNSQSSSSPMDSKESEIFAAVYEPVTNVPESEIVYLKMSVTRSETGQECQEEDDVDWFFDKRTVHSSPENKLNNHYNSLNHEEKERNLKNGGKYFTDEMMQILSGHEISSDSNDRLYSDGVIQNNIKVSDDKSHKATVLNSTATNENKDKYDSDFEDCFDDFDHQKHATVVVESESKVNNDDLKATKQIKSGNYNDENDDDDFKSILLNLNRLQNMNNDFELSSNVSYSKSKSSHQITDNDCDDCFDEEGSQVNTIENKSSNSDHMRTNAALADCRKISTKDKPQTMESNINSVKDKNAWTKDTSVNSEITKLNSLLKQISHHKSPNVKQILCSTRHDLKEVESEGNQTNVSAANEKNFSNSAMSIVVSSKAESKSNHKKNFTKISTKEKSENLESNMTCWEDHTMTKDTPTLSEIMNFNEKEPEEIVNHVNVSNSIVLPPTEDMKSYHSENPQLISNVEIESVADVTESKDKTVSNECKMSGSSSTFEEINTMLKHLHGGIQKSSVNMAQVLASSRHIDNREDTGYGKKKPNPTIDASNSLSKPDLVWQHQNTKEDLVRDGGEIEVIVPLAQQDYKKDNNENTNDQQYFDKNHYANKQLLGDLVTDSCETAEATIPLTCQDFRNDNNRNTNNVKVSFDQNHCTSTNKQFLKSVVDVVNKDGSFFELDPDVHSLRGREIRMQIPEDVSYLSRESDDLMQLVEQVYFLQTQDKTADNERFDLSKVHCVSVRSSNCFKEVVSGLVITCSTDVMERMVAPSSSSPRNTLLVNGDLKSNYVHKGHKSVIAKKLVVEREASLNSASQGKEHTWACNIIDVLKKLEVSVLLVKGRVCDTLSDMLYQEHILVLPAVSFRVLEIVSHLYRVPLMTYIQDAIQSDVCHLRYNPVDKVWMDRHEDSHCLLISDLPHIQTIVIQLPSLQACHIEEERVWKCVHRLSNAVKDGLVLPGAGMSEDWCQQTIRAMARGEHTGGPHSVNGLIMQSLAQVFQDYVSVVRFNVTAEDGKSCSRSLQQQPPVIQRQQSFTSNCLTGKMEDSVGPPASSNFQEKFIAARRNNDVKEIKGISQINKSPRRNDDGTKEMNLEKDGDDADDYNKYEYGNNLKQEMLKAASADQNEELCHISQYDTFSSKVSSWSSALDLVQVLLSLDSLVITGASKSDLSVEEVLL